MTPGKDRIGRGIAAALAAVLLLSVLAFGSVHAWATSLLEISIWLLATIWMIAGGGGRAPRAVLVSAVALYAYLALQTLPLPPALLGALSPETAAIYERTAGVVSGLPAGGPTVSRSGIDEGTRAIVEDAGSLASGEAGGPARVGWRPLALDPFVARSKLRLYLALGAAIWLAATLPAPRLLLRSAVVSAVLVALLALVQYATWNGRVLWFFKPYDWPAEIPDYPRMLGPFVNPDHLAALLAMALLPGAALVATAWERRRRRSRRDPAATGVVGATLLGIGLALVTAALVGSASRGGILGAVLGAVALWWGLSGEATGSVDPARRRRKENRAQRFQRLTRQYAPAVVALSIVAGGLTYAGPRARTLLDVRLGDLVDTVSAPSLDFRYLMWRQSLPILGDFPLFGVGIGGWREVFRRYEAYPMVGYRPNHAHNDYLEWAVEVGLAGVLLTAVLVSAYVAWGRRNDSIPRTIRWGILGAIVAIGWHELVDFSLRIPANALLLSLLLGLLCNPYWQDPPEAAPHRSRRGSIPIALAVVAFVLFTTGSVRQLREFLQWTRVRGGATELSFSPRSAETWYELGMNLYRAGKRYDAVTQVCFREAVLRLATMEKAWWRISRTATDPETRLRALETAVYLDPTRARWRISYALLLNKIGRREDALREVEEAVYRNPYLDRHPYLDPGKATPTTEVLEAAERGFRRLIAERPDDERLLAEAATFFERFGVHVDAAELWEQAAVAAGDWSRFGVRAGESWAQVGNRTLAEMALRRAIGNAPNRPDGYRSLAMNVFRPARQYEAAAETLELAIRRVRDPGLLEALYQIRWDVRDLDGALEAFTRAAELGSRDPNLQYRLGNAYLTAGNFHRAKIVFDRALALDPGRAWFHHQKGRALEELYDLGGAREAFRRASELEPDNETFAASVARIEKSFTERSP